MSALGRKPTFGEAMAALPIVCDAHNLRHMYHEPIYALLFWFYDKVEERYGRLAVGIAQFALCLIILTLLVGLLIWFTR